MVGVECAARARLFQAAVARRIAPWDLLRLGDGCSSFFEALLRFLSRAGWRAEVCVLGAEVGSGVARYREEAGAIKSLNLGPTEWNAEAPTSIRIGEVRTTLQCVDDGGRSLSLELEGPGEAVLLACWGGVALEASHAIWEARAVTRDRLPEVQMGRCRTLVNALGLAAARRAG